MQNSDYQTWQIAKEAWPIALPVLMLGLGLWPISFVLVTVGVLAFLCVLAFFRIPPLTVVLGDHAILSPAYGHVVEISQSNDRQKIGIFMSVFDVHVNYVPVDGKVIDIQYQPGSFKSALSSKASECNESLSMTIESTVGLVQVKQIAGLIARRIVCYAEKGMGLVQGLPFGLIKFGSRVDLFLPAQVKIMVHKGQKVHGGKSIIGILS